MSSGQGEATATIQCRTGGLGQHGEGERTGPAAPSAEETCGAQPSPVPLLTRGGLVGLSSLSQGRTPASPARCQTSLPLASSTWTGTCSARTLKVPSTASLCWRRRGSSPRSVALVSGEAGSWVLLVEKCVWPMSGLDPGCPCRA